MGIFDPKVDADVAIEQTAPPVTPVASGGAGAAVVSNLLQGLSGALAYRKASAPTAGERKDALELAQNQGLQNGLVKVEALRREGRIADAQRLEQRVLANYARDGGDLSSGQTKGLYRATTGRDPEFMGMSVEERMSEEVMKTPEFQGAFMATYASGKEMSESERVNVAMYQVARQQANTQALTNDSIDWNSGRREAFSSTIQSFSNTVVGGLSVAAQQRGVVDLQTINAAQASWDQQKSALLALRPTGVSDAEWKPVQAQIDQVDTTFKNLIEISTVEGSRGLNAQALQPIVSALMSDEALNPTQKYAAIGALPKLVELGVVPPSDVQDVLRNLKVPTNVTPSAFVAAGEGKLKDPKTGEPQLFSPEIMSAAKGVDAMETLGKAKAISKVTSAMDGDTLMADPKNEEDFTLLASTAFAAMTTISADNGEFASADTINRVFDGSIVANIKAIAQRSPAKARALFMQGEEALSQQHAVAVQALRNQTKGPSVLSWDEGSKQLVVNEASLQRLGFSPDNLLLLRATADQYYGGDYVGMLQDRGNRISATPEAREARELLRMGFLQSVQGEAKELQALANNVRAIDEKRMQFAAEADALVKEKDTPTTVKPAPAVQDGTIDLSVVRGAEAVQEDTAFLNSVAATSERLGMNPNDLLAAISFETAGTFDPGIKNPLSSATGLIQFMGFTAKNLGTSTTMLRNMTREEQMVYVEKYLKPFKGRLNNLGDVYMAIHWPVAVGKSDDYVMYKAGSKEYEGNKNLDLNGDGTVTRGEALQRVINHNAGGSAAGQITTTSLGSTNGGNANPEAEATAPTQPTDNSDTPEGISATVVDAMQIADAGAVAATREDPSIVDREAPEKPAEPEKGKTVSRALDSQAIANMVTSKLSPSDLRKLRAAGVRPEEVEFFKDQAEAEAALAAGEVSKGTVYITETGNIFMLE